MERLYPAPTTLRWRILQFTRRRSSRPSQLQYICYISCYYGLVGWWSALLAQFAVPIRSKGPKNPCRLRRVAPRSGQLVVRSRGANCGPFGLEHPCPLRRIKQLQELPILQPALGLSRWSSHELGAVIKKATRRCYSVHSAANRASGCSARAAGCIKSQSVQKKVTLCLLGASIIRPSSFLFGRGSCTRAPTPPNYVVQAAGASSLGFENAS